MRAPNDVADEAPLVIVANVPTYRGFLTLTPEATLFDGLLDVLVVPPLGKQALGVVPRVLPVLVPPACGSWGRDWVSLLLACCREGRASA